MGFFDHLPDRFEVCYEASCSYGFYHDSLRPLTARVVESDSGQLQLIVCSSHKNDRPDANKLARLLILGELSAVHLPNVDVRSWHERITCGAI